MKLLISFVAVAVIAASVSLIFGIPFGHPWGSNARGDGPHEDAALATGEDSEPTALEEKKVEMEILEESTPNGRETVALFDEVEVRGRVVREADQILAEFSLENKAESSSEFSISYEVWCTPGGEIDSRMMPPMRKEKDGFLEIAIGPGEKLRKFVVVKKMDKGELAEVTAEGSDESRLPDTWTLSVSKNKSDEVAYSGARVPVSLPGRIEAGRGKVVLGLSSIR